MTLPGGGRLGRCACQGNAELYSVENIAKRAALSKNPDIAAAAEQPVRRG